MLKAENITVRYGEHTVGDEVHFAPSGMRELGRRYAEKYLEAWRK